MRDFKIVRSRVSNGIPSTTLVAAMISSAGSEEKSRCVLCQAISTLIGMIVNWRKQARNSGLSMSRTRRPSWISFANSQSTTSEMAKGSRRTKRRSRGRKSSTSTATSMWVSRFSTPVYTGGKEIAFDFDLPLHRANQRLIVDSRKGNDTRDRATALGDDDSLRIESAQHLKASRLEFAGCHYFLFGFHMSK